MGDGQHTWAAAEWILMMRSCFLQEEPAKGRLVLGAGLLPSWLEAGSSMAIGPAPTLWGPVDVTINTSGETAHVRWAGQWRRERPRVEIRVPGFEPVLVTGDRGDVRLTK